MRLKSLFQSGRENAFCTKAIPLLDELANPLLISAAEHSHDEKRSINPHLFILAFLNS